MLGHHCSNTPLQQQSVGVTPEGMLGGAQKAMSAEGMEGTLKPAGLSGWRHSICQLTELACTLIMSLAGRDGGAPSGLHRPLTSMCV